MASPLIRIPVPGAGNAEFIVRTPAIATLLVNGWLPLPLVYAVSQILEADGPQWVIESDEDVRERQETFLDRWVVACAISPRIVLEEAEASESVLHVAEVGRAMQVAIFTATYLPLVRTVRASARQFEAFVTDSLEALGIAAFARAHGQRPSGVLGVTDPAAAIDVDLAISLRFAAEQTQRLEDIQHRPHARVH